MMPVATKSPMTLEELTVMVKFAVLPTKVPDTFPTVPLEVFQVPLNETPLCSITKTTVSAPPALELLEPTHVPVMFSEVASVGVGVIISIVPGGGAGAVNVTGVGAGVGVRGEVGMGVTAGVGERVGVGDETGVAAGAGAGLAQPPAINQLTRTIINRMKKCLFTIFSFLLYWFQND
jgi:hypothetical protein